MMKLHIQTEQIVKTNSIDEYYRNAQTFTLIILKAKKTQEFNHALLNKTQYIRYK